ncbi:MAG: GNAT family N-acetyltransferase [Defluviimonas sp.]|uniref:GNAT family N-acetyltransferase n=1 Tax=Albidovulum sp. TaxID=1872424 RepID=UPI001DD41A26|nr:GNAT family N-acetyltransferase [Paracoccaceae bacterium]MCC0062881.1 GNAT family N-acetyltransferase [Defluviimonas sp.]
MAGPTIRTARRTDVALLSAALRALSVDLGDRHAASDADIAAAGFGARPVFRAQIAVSAGQPVGAAVYSPIYSTTRARPGVYVSDLWVAAAARGGGLGAKLLAAVRDDARARWGAGFVRLVVYADNPRALGFYTRLGFALRSDEAGMLLEGAALERLGGSR